jgi:hypothetical protein
MATIESVAELRRALGAVRALGRDDAEDYQIAAAVGTAFLARTRSAAPALLIPLDAAPTAAGRRGGGFALIAAGCVAFNHSGRHWEQPAAALECTDPDLLETFLVLVVDLIKRLTSSSEAVTWPTILAWVEDWQALLARRTTLTTEQQLGLWGELWLITNAINPDQLIAAWRGPEREPVDFFVNGIAVEVKASRNAHVHHVSQSQIDRPVGMYPAYLLSIWVGVDPARGASLKELAEKLLSRVSDPPALLKHMALAGYVPQDSDQYASRFVALERPSWFRADDVPRVRQIDQGISSIRYIVHLDTDMAISAAQADGLWRDVCGVIPLNTSDTKPLCD